MITMIKQEIEHSANFPSPLILMSSLDFPGIQQTPAVGRAIMELIIHGQYRTIDLSRMGFDRLIVDQPMFEANIV